MVDNFFFKSMKQHISCDLEYKASFILKSISHVFIFITYYFMILTLFGKFETLAGFSKYEVLLVFGIIHFGYSINETFFRAIDQFEEFIIEGTLDRFFLRPRNILFQLCCFRTDFSRITRCLQALIIAIIALVNLKIEWSISKVIILILMVISSTVLFFSLFILAASICFKTVQGLEIKNLITDGMKHSMQYPISYLNEVLKKIFTYIIPFAFINYYPLLYFLGRSDNILYIFTPLLVIPFVILSIIVFNLGLKHYNSVGS